MCQTGLPPIDWIDAFDITIDIGDEATQTYDSGTDKNSNTGDKMTQESDSD